MYPNEFTHELKVFLKRTGIFENIKATFENNLRYLMVHVWIKYNAGYLKFAYVNHSLFYLKLMG